MKKLIILVLVAAACFYGYKVYRGSIKIDFPFKTQIKTQVAAIGGKINTAGTVRLTEDFKKKHSDIPEDKIIKPDQKVETGRPVKIYLKHGGMISGLLLEQDEKGYTVEWHGEKCVILASQVKKIIDQDEEAVEWQYKSNVVVKKTNGVILDGEITAVGKDDITMAFDEGGGSLEMGVKRSEIDHIIASAVYNKETRDTEKRLRDLFPKLKVYREGNITLLTDSYKTNVDLFRKDLNKHYTDIYFKFFKLFKGRKPQYQSFVVVFDNPENYFENMFADMGFATARIVGYFSSRDNVLCIYNAWGSEWEKLYYDWVQEVSKEEDKIAEGQKSRFKDTSADMVIEGMNKEIQDKYWDWYNLHKTMAMEQTHEVLRHEFTHEIFHDWGLQNVILSKTNLDKDKMAQKKKEIIDALKSKDRKKMEDLFKIMKKLRTEEEEYLQVDSSHSWLTEGIATYCEAEPIGGIAELWLFEYQEMERKNEVNPIEFLTNLNMGSFVELCPEAQLGSYGESWALTNFLMAKYPNQFMEFQAKMAENKNLTEKSKEQLQLLLKCLNKDLPTLEAEFHAYMKTFPKVDDPRVKEFLRYQKVIDDFKQVFKEDKWFYL